MLEIFHKIYIRNNELMTFLQNFCRRIDYLFFIGNFQPKIDFFVSHCEILRFVRFLEIRSIEKLFFKEYFHFL